jgi:hypothetical protein
MDAWVLDRLVDRHPVRRDVEDDLQDRAAQPHRARAADDEPGPLAFEHERRRHHAGQPLAAQRAAVFSADRVEVVLAEHVVQVNAGARHDRP